MNDVTLTDALASLESTAVKERTEGLANLRHILRHNQGNSKIGNLKDSSYRKIFDTLFRFASTERLAASKSKATKTASAAEGRLSKCATTLRVAVDVGVRCLRAKSVKMLVDHILDMFVKENGEHHTALALDYPKCLSTVLSYEPHVEHLPQDYWKEVTSFCLDRVQSVAKNDDPLGSSILSMRSSRSHIAGSQANTTNSGLPSQAVDDFVSCLRSLTSLSYAPLLNHASQIFSTMTQYLASSKSVGESQLDALVTINNTLLQTRTENLNLTRKFLREALTLAKNLWNSKLSVVKDEVLVMLVLLQPYIEHIPKGDENEAFIAEIGNLFESFKGEYIRRPARDHLHLNHLSLQLSTVSSQNGLRCQVFALRDGLATGKSVLTPEHNWTLLCLLALLSVRGNSSKQKMSGRSESLDAGPNKRQRYAHWSDDFLRMLSDSGYSAKVCALQLIAFAAQSIAIDEETLENLVEKVARCVNDDNSVVASWAHVALASCATQVSAQGQMLVKHWSSIWQLTTRAVNPSLTCRSSCHLLHVMMRAELVDRASILESTGRMLASIAVNGPTVFCDSVVSFLGTVTTYLRRENSSASLERAEQVLTWLFRAWAPSNFNDKVFAAQNINTDVTDVLDLVNSCLGVAAEKKPVLSLPVWGSVAQAWILHDKERELLDYLLLQKRGDVFLTKFDKLDTPIESGLIFHATNESLVLGLCTTEINRAVEKWESIKDQGVGQLDENMVQMVGILVIAGLCLRNCLNGKDNYRATQLGTANEKLMDLLFRDLASQTSDQKKVDAFLRLIALHMVSPRSGVSDEDGHKTHMCMSKLSHKVLHLLETRRGMSQSDSLVQNNDLSDIMDMDTDFESQMTSHTNQPAEDVLSRKVITSSHSAAAQRAGVMVYSKLMQLSDNSGDVQDHYDYEGDMKTFVKYVAGFSIPDMLASRPVLSALPHFGLSMSTKELDVLLGYFADNTLPSYEYERAEINTALVLDLMRGFIHTWTDPSDVDLYGLGGDIYKWLMGALTQGKMLSAVVQQRLAQMLLELLHIDAEYGQKDDLPPVCTMVFTILRHGSLKVKHFIAEHISSIFHLFSLSKHEETFEELRSGLPSDAEWIEGIAIRVLVFANLASKWHSLLRRCVYNIFETAGMIPDSGDYAVECIATVSNALGVESGRDIFQLFAPQLLFTWLAEHPLEKAPFRVFDYETMAMLLEDNLDEIYSQLVLRHQDEAIRWLTQELKSTEDKILHATFSKAVAHAISWDVCGSQPTDPSQSTPCETRLRDLFKTNGDYYKTVQSHFPYILAQIFESIHQDELIERTLGKRPQYKYAKDALTTMKQYGSLDRVLPATQEPWFKGKYLIDQLERACRRTGMKTFESIAQVLDVSSIAVTLRSLIDGMHPAYGPLHTCQTVRKLRILIALSGDVIFYGYPLQMLIRTLQPIVVESHCADDAMGVLRYLLDRGKDFLRQEISMLTGTSLLIILSLKQFMASRQDKTTQESQFRNTVSKMQTFHDWLVDYLLQFKSDLADGKQKAVFSNLVLACRDLELSGPTGENDPAGIMLKELLDDEENKNPILGPLERKQVIAMLCQHFEAPDVATKHVFDTDPLAAAYANRVWSSVQLLPVANGYKTWAAKVLGRAYCSTVSLELIRPSQGIISGLVDSTGGTDRSKRAIVGKLKDLLSSENRKYVGTSEQTLRKIYSRFVDLRDHNGAIEFEQLLPSHVASAVSTAYSNNRWIPADGSKFLKASREKLFQATKLDKTLSSKAWVQRLAITICDWVNDNPFINPLSDLLRTIEGSASELFPFIIHLALGSEMEKEQVVRTYMSESFINHFQSEDVETDRKSRLLLETLLYLLTQEIPQERTRMSRLLWLDMDYFIAAQAAARCNMPTAALYLGEVGETTETGHRVSRRSSTETIPVKTPSNELLLSIYSSVDDPDSFYGVEQPASLESVLARVHHEGDGLKGMMLHSARIDASLRQSGRPEELDSFGMIGSMGVMNLNSITHDLLHRRNGNQFNFAATDTMLEAARKLEQWDISPPQKSESATSTLYSIFRNLSTASTLDGLRDRLNNALRQSIQRVQNPRLDAATARATLSAIAVLTEVDELTSVRCTADLSKLWDLMQTRQQNWDIGRQVSFNEAQGIVSYRETLFSLLSRNNHLREALHVSIRDCRMIEARAVISSSQFARRNDLIQQSLTAATYLSQLVPKCQEIDVKMDAAAHFEVASTLWRQGETSSSVQMLQELCSRKDLMNQAIQIGRAGMLAQLGHEVAEARLEKPDEVITNYLKPAIEQLNKATSGAEAGRVYHEFASFCDQQLQNSGNVEDFQRLTKLRERKRTEIEQWDNLLKANAKDAKNNAYRRGKLTAQRWFQLDDQEYQKMLQSRDEFVQQSLQNYLRALEVSDEFDSSVVRFFALWLEHSHSGSANAVVERYLPRVPSWKLAGLMNQETSRLQDDRSLFQKTLSNLITRICADHPYHGLQQIFSSVNGAVHNEAATSRRQAAMRIARALHQDQRIGPICKKIFKASDCYHKLADIKVDTSKGNRLALSSVKPAAEMDRDVRALGVPPATLSLELRPNADYSNIPTITRFRSDIRIAGGLSAPKILIAVGSDGKEYVQLFKGGNDDLRQDAIMEQVFGEVSKMLRNHKSCRQRNLHVRTYKVLPLTSTTGIIEFVPNSIPLGEFLVPAHLKYNPSDLKEKPARDKIRNAQDMPKESRYKVYREVAAKYQPVLRHFFFERFEDPDDWFQKRLNYTRSTATISILGHILGLGDRHCHNILLDEKSGEAIHIDLGVAFEAGRILPVPEVVPFRLTRDIVDGMGVTKTEGVFRRCCEFSMEALRDEQDGIMTLLNVLRYDPLYTWTVSPVKARRMQDAQQETGIDVSSKRPEDDAGEAARALAIVEKKLSKTLSTAATVNELIQQATDERNLAVLFAGWAPHS